MMNNSTEKDEMISVIAAWKKLCSRKARKNFDVDLFAETVVSSYNILKKHEDDARPPRETKRIFSLILRFIKPRLAGCDEYYAAKTVAEDLSLSFDGSDMIGDYEGGVTVDSILYAVDGLLESFKYAEENK